MYVHELLNDDYLAELGKLCQNTITWELFLRQVRENNSVDCLSAISLHKCYTLIVNRWLYIETSLCCQE